MRQKQFRIKNKLGLHARPAALFVQTISGFKSKVKVIKDGQEVDGRSIMGLMMLAAEYGSDIMVHVDGPDEGLVLKEIQNIINRKFDED